MKFDHNFTQTTATPTGRTYAADGWQAQLDFLSGSCLRVALYRDADDLLPTFNIDPDNASIGPQGRVRLSTVGFQPTAPTVTENDSGTAFALPCGVTAELDFHNLLLTYKIGDRVLFADRGPLAYNLDKEFGTGATHYITRERDERIYGLGDKGGSVNKAGRRFRIDTADSMGFDAAMTDPLYKHTPFYICQNSVGCYGIFYDTTAPGEIDLGREINNYYPPFKYYRSAEDCLVYYVFFGSKLEILQQFCRTVGRQPLPPKWSFDYCASTMAYTDAPKSEEKMDAFLAKVRALDLNCSGFYLSSGYTAIGNQRCVFHWNREKFPDPARFIGKFNAAGVHLIPNIKPAFLTSHPMYDDLAAKGLFVKNADGSPYVTQFWDGLGSYLDFTNPEAFAFWHDQVTKKLLQNGMDATWNDNNEFDIQDPTAVAVGFGGKAAPAAHIRPALTYLMVLSSYQAQMEMRPAERPFLSTRSAGIGLRRLAQTWSGDNYTSFHDLRYCHYVGMTLSLSGFYFYGHDLGGFSGEMPSKELLLRWIQHGVFEPRFTIHSWNADGSATMPWSYPEVMDSVHALFDQRKALLPYYYSTAYRSVQEELPLQAPLCLYYDDPQIDPDDPAFLLGRDLLAACVLDPGMEDIEVYLPSGEIWYKDDRCYTGGQTVELHIPATGTVPYFVRGGCVFPLDIGPTGFQKPSRVQFTVYPIADGTFQSRYFDDDGHTYAYRDGHCVDAVFTVACAADTVTVQVENRGDTPFAPNIRLTPADHRQLIIK